MGEDSPTFTVRHCFASNEDGDRHLVVDAEDWDMSGWRLRTVDEFGNVDEYPFETSTGWGSPGEVTFVGYGETRQVWIAPSQWGTKRATVVDTGGVEYVVFGS